MAEVKAMNINWQESHVNRKAQVELLKQEIHTWQEPLKLGVLVSGTGSNLQSILDAITQEKINVEVCVKSFNGLVNNNYFFNSNLSIINQGNN